MRGHQQSLRHSASMTIGNGIMIAVVPLDGQPEEEPHDDF
jgi:hypothetical protein